MRIVQLLRPSRWLAAGLVACCLGSAQVAHAQFANGFYYYNPRTGFSYSQGAAFGNGYYNGGFAVSTPHYSYSTGYGYGGGYRHRHYWGGSSYSNHRHAYSQYWRH